MVVSCQGEIGYIFLKLISDYLQKYFENFYVNNYLWLLRG